VVVEAVTLSVAVVVAVTLSVAVVVVVVVILLVVPVVVTLLVVPVVVVAPLAVQVARDDSNNELRSNAVQRPIAFRGALLERCLQSRLDKSDAEGEASAYYLVMLYVHSITQT